MPLPQYRRRALESTFAEHASHKVAILEGRRAVGKSSLARHLTDIGPYASYQSLTDPAVAERAKRDASRWVSSLRRPAVIDEAQMVPNVSVAIKALVDTLPQGHHFLLTGSASVVGSASSGTGLGVFAFATIFAAIFDFRPAPERAPPRPLPVDFVMRPV